MQLTLTDHEAHLLREVLDSYVKGLHVEFVETDDPGSQPQLHNERDALLAIVARLEPQPHLDEPALTKMVRITAVLTEYD